ncbi:MAG TPA: hypothetical protein VKA67_12265 [Verrucomicrobiae bacterium]|nr:hypothetical protein [Verrucomicrobiae bacterium]
MNSETKTTVILTVLCVVFLALASAFSMNWLGHRVSLKPIPLVDTNFLSTATVRQAYPDLAREGADLSEFECYICHEQGKPPPLRHDANGKLLIPSVHSDIVMGHGTWANNNCFMCHNATNLTTLLTRDGREVSFSDSQLLCGSCHGPIYRDWQAGEHGRTSGYWDRSRGPIDRKICVNCHNPHSPHFPGRQPAPGPRLLHPTTTASAEPVSSD